MSQLRILACGHALEIQPKEWSYPSGGTIRQAIIAARSAGLVDELLVDADGRVSHGCNLHVVVAHPKMSVVPVAIPSEAWDVIRPKPGMVVSLALRPGKGGGGGKSPMRVLLTIAVVAASFYVGGLAATYAANSLGMGALGSQLIGGAVGGLTPICGVAVLNLVAAPKSTTRL